MGMASKVILMDLSSVTDFANKANDEIHKYTIPIILAPDKLMTTQYAVSPLKWDVIEYGDKDLLKVPDDKRGIYAFAVHHRNNVLPPHGYVMYIGIAGRNSKRSLRARYREYLNPKAILKRPKIARMIGHWKPVLKFFFAAVDDSVSAKDLLAIESQLNTALMPPCVEGDLEAETKKKRKAFR
jgi:hypothetical protein